MAMMVANMISAHSDKVGMLAVLAALVDQRCLVTT